MPSPFPGMDPYLQPQWGDFHHRFCTYACDALQPQVQPQLVARLNQRVVIEDDSSDGDRASPRVMFPDVYVAQDSGSPVTAVAANVTASEPMVVRYAGPTSGPQGFIEIIDPANGNRVVTVVELLSPSNKRRGDGLRQYRQKQVACRRGRVTLVEVDLIRGGRWVLDLPREQVPADRRRAYTICVRRGWRKSTFEVYTVGLDQPLPAIRVPLRKGDADVTLDLQAVFAEAYAKGVYGSTIDYAADADPPLTAGAAAWADGLLRAAGRR